MRPLFGLLLTALLALGALSFPPLSGRVVDSAHLLPSPIRTRLQQRLTDLEKEQGIQLVVVTLPSLQGDDIADYGYRLGRHWGIGKKERDNGLLLIVAPRERKVRIEVGYGLEGIVTDYAAHQIIEEKILPRFRAHDMAGGIEAGVAALLTLLKKGTDSSSSPDTPSENSFLNLSEIAMTLGLALVLVFLRRGGELYGHAAILGVVTGLLSWNAFSSPWIGLAAAALAFGLYVVFRKRFGERMVTASSDLPGWSSAAESRRLDPGDFESFSGGGGSFGGGGASGSW